MSAPIAKSHMAFELPKLSYIDTRFEEPAAAPAATPARPHTLATWIAARVAAFRAWRVEQAGIAELNAMSDRELFDVGLNRGDLDRVFDDRFNRDLRRRGH